MGKRGHGYGSEDQLLRYRMHRPNHLDSAFIQAIGSPETKLNWIYPPDRILTRAMGEPEGMEFLKGDDATLAKWRGFWPQKGKQPTWDGVAMALHARGSEWVLVEAKANRPEFCSGPCGAVGSGRRKIERAMAEVKKHLEVHLRFPWLGTYYQYANRLACLYFLTQVAGAASRLAFVYFYGDSFPDETPCPNSEAEWREAIHACHLTLGLPATHALSSRVHEVFLPALREG
jgi:hypothetical protein